MPADSIPSCHSPRTETSARPVSQSSSNEHYRIPRPSKRTSYGQDVAQPFQSKPMAPMSENGMDRPCSRPASEHACVGQQKEDHAMPQSNTAVVTIGIDPGKNTLHLVGLDARGGIALREKVVRARIVARLANVPPCLIGIEAGMGTHYVTRELLALNHDVRQVPPVYAKPFRQTHKNDFRDALAVAEAVQRPTTRCVPPKTDE